MNPRHLVLTPGMTGRDGIAGVSRLIVSALLASTPGPAPERVQVLSLRDPAGSMLLDGGNEAIHVEGASGRKVRLIASALRAGLRRPRPAEVFCLHLGLSPVARILAGSRARLTAFLYGIEAWRPLARTDRWALERADVLVAISEHTARRFREANPTFSSRSIRVCRLGVATGADSPAPAGERAWPAPFALIVGRMAAEERYKGHDLLIDIWPRVASEVPGARLVVAGDGDDRARLEARATPLGDGVKFLGPVSDSVLTALYRDCAFFVMPSAGEGFGLVFLEAMREGKACIGGVGAAAEVIEDGVTGLVVDPGEPEAVLKAVLRLFREPETRERMGRAGALRVAQEFTEEHFRRRFRAALGLDTLRP